MRSVGDTDSLSARNRERLIGSCPYVLAILAVVDRVARVQPYSSVIWAPSRPTESSQPEHAADLTFDQTTLHTSYCPAPVDTWQK